MTTALPFCFRVARPSRQQVVRLLEMLGLDPLPAKTDLHATITGTVAHDEFRVENLHFQSRPGLYVTGNLYSPNQVAGKLPAILYLEIRRLKPDTREK